MTALLTENLPQLVGAPNGIRKLRELILELAIRGKLMPQDLNDEPAIELLQPIAEEKARLVKEGKLKKQKPSANIGMEEKPFDFPTGWLPVYLADIVALVTDGDHQPPPKAVEGVPFLVIGNLNTGNIRFEGCRRVPHDYFDALDWGRKPCQGDILYTVTGSFGIPIIVDVDESFCVQRHVAIIKTTEHLPSEYLRVVLASPYAKNYAAIIATGIAQKTVPLTGLRQLIIPLPPLTEQHRIVAKVDELMALCDRLEAQQVDAESAHARLIQALLDCLTQAKNATDFAAIWQRLAEHFHTLFTTESSIDALKLALLQLAMLGKLVPQNSKDESGTKLSERIQLSRSDKRKIVMLAEDAVSSYIELLPETWTWSSVDQISADEPRAITDGPFGANLKTEHYIETPGYRVVRLQNIGNGDFRNEHRAYIDQDRFEKISKHQVFSGDLIVAGLIDTSIRCCIAPENIGPAVVKADCYRFSVHPQISSKYVLYYLNSKMAREFAAIHHHGLTLTRIGLGNFRHIPVPLPPAAEQHRIVAKVDELMALCEQLKNRLTQARQLNEQLASTLVERVVA